MILKTILPCLCVFIFTLPVVMCTYFRISLLSVIINPIILVFMSMLLVSGLTAGVISALFSGGVLASLFAGPVYFILKLYEYLCEAEKWVPCSHVVTGTCAKPAVISFYAVLLSATVILIRYRKKSVLFALLNPDSVLS